MPTARELLEQADALMRRNRSPILDDIPVLTDSVAQLPPTRVLRARPPAPQLQEPRPAESDAIPTLTETVAAAPPAVVRAVVEEGEPSDWLQLGQGEPSAISEAPDSIAIVPEVAPELPPAEDSLAEEIEITASPTEAEEAFDEEIAHRVPAAPPPAPLESPPSASSLASAYTGTPAPVPDFAFIEDPTVSDLDALDDDIPTLIRTEGAAPREESEALAEEPTALAEEPTALAEERAVLAEEPAALAEEPAGLAEEPAGLAEEPAALAEEPVALAEEPVPLAEEPAALAEEPAALAEEPVALAEEPVPRAEEPATLAEEPVPLAEEPAALAEEPVPLAEEPAALAQREPLRAPESIEDALLGASFETTTALAASAAAENARWSSVAEEIRVQVLQRIDLFTDTGLREQLGSRLQPIVDRASADLVATINQHVGELLRAYVAEAIEREIENWRQNR